MPVTKKIRGKLGESLEVSAEPASLKVPTGQPLQLDGDVSKRVEKGAPARSLAARRRR